MIIENEEENENSYFDVKINFKENEMLPNMSKFSDNEIQENITIKNSFIQELKRCETSLIFDNSYLNSTIKKSSYSLNEINFKPNTRRVDLNLNLNTCNFLSLNTSSIVNSHKPLKKRSFSSKLIRINRSKIYRELQKNNPDENKHYGSYIEEANSIIPKRKRSCSVKKLKMDSHHCDICYCPLEDPTTMECCNNKYCSSCLGEYINEGLRTFYNKLNSTINNYDEIVMFICPNKSCVTPLLDNLIKKLISQENYEKYEKIKEFGKILKNKENVLCPFPDCDSYALKNTTKKNKLICISNKHEFCLKCNNKYHTDSPCEKELVIDAKEAQLKKMKKCPKCEIWIEKKEGCNHMTCMNLRCGYEFCWLCLGKYSANHYINPFSPCYRKSHDEDSSDSITSNKFCVILRGLGIFLLFTLLGVILLSLLSIAFCIFALIILLYNEFHDLHISFKTKCAKILFYTMQICSFLLIGVFSFSIGFLVSVLLLGTSPAWLTVLWCYTLYIHYRNQREDRDNNIRIRRRPIVRRFEDQPAQNIQSVKVEPGQGDVNEFIDASLMKIDINNSGLGPELQPKLIIGEIPLKIKENKDDNNFSQHNQFNIDNEAGLTN